MLPSRLLPECFDCLDCSGFDLVPARLFLEPRRTPATIEDVRNVIILGSGCAGNTAAIYAARAGLNPLVVIGHEPGGQLSLTTDVENFPGFPEGINGPDLVENMKKQAEEFGAEFMYGSVTEAELKGTPIRLNIDGEWHETRTLSIASGAS